MKLREVQMLGILALIAVAIVLLCMWGGEDRPQQTPAVVPEAPFGRAGAAVDDVVEEWYARWLSGGETLADKSARPDERESTIEIGSNDLLEPSTEEAQIQDLLDEAPPDEIPLAPSAPAAAGGEAPAPEPRRATPRTHVVLAGDTLSGISAQYYGTTAHWRRIHEVNRDVLPDPNTLTVGVQLKIPVVSPPARDVAKSEPSTAAGSFHIVQKGESLYRIAEKYYGSGDEANRLRIVEANPKLIADESRIREGIRLLIP